MRGFGSSSRFRFLYRSIVVSLYRFLVLADTYLPQPYVAWISKMCQHAEQFPRKDALRELVCDDFAINMPEKWASNNSHLLRMLKVV